MVAQLDLPLQEQWARKGRFLTQALIFSGALNIGLLTSFCYFIVREKKEAVVFELQPLSEGEKAPLQLTNGEVLTQFSTLSYGELVAMLESEEPVETGYKKRDLALACLVAFHFIDLEKAMQGAPLQKRTLSFQRKEGPEQVDMTVYPGLSGDQYRAIVQFINTEKFPFTAQGLFFELKQASKPRDSALLEAFYLTSEYITFSTLLARVGISLPAGYVIDLMTEGDWEILKQFTEQQKQSQDLSPTRLKTVLARYISCRSLLAAKILLQWDRQFILKKFEDPDLMTFIDLFSQKSDALELFLKELITSPRSDAIWKKAAEKLYALANIPCPELCDQSVVLKTFAPGRLVQEIPTQPSKIHIVQPGDNLWKIARKYQVSIESLRQINQLESDKLRPGKKLKIN